MRSTDPFDAMRESPLAAARAYAVAVDGTPRRRAARALAFVLRNVARVSAFHDRLPASLAGPYRRLLAGGLPKATVHCGVVATSGSRTLIVSHDLSASGAPRIVYEIAEILSKQGHRVTVLSALDGPFRAQLVALGAVVLIDASILAPGSKAVAAMAAASDRAICNTVVTAAAVDALASRIPTYWYVHEVSLLHERLACDASLASTFARAAGVWAGSEMSAILVRPHRPDVRVLPYGLDPIRPDECRRARGRKLLFHVFGSIESRKGQDLAAAAVALLSPAEREAFRCVVYGRVLDQAFGERLASACATLPEVTLGGELDATAYRAALLDGDAVLVPSRDDTLPLVSLDALGASRVLLCTPTTGTSAYLDDGVNGFVAASCDAEAIAAMLSIALARREDWDAIGAAGKAAFDRTFSKDAFTARILADLGIVPNVCT